MNRTGPSSDRTSATKNGTRRNSSKLDQRRNPQEETSRQKIPDLLQRSVQRHPHIVLTSHHAISSPRQRLSSVGKEATTKKIRSRTKTRLTLYRTMESAVCAEFKILCARIEFRRARASRQLSSLHFDKQTGAAMA